MQLIQYFQHPGREPSVHADIQVQQSITNGSLRNLDKVNVFEVGCKNLLDARQNQGTLIIDGAWRQQDKMGVAVVMVKEWPYATHQSGINRDKSAFWEKSAVSTEYVETFACLKAVLWAV